MPARLIYRIAPGKAALNPAIATSILFTTHCPTPFSLLPPVNTAAPADDIRR